MTPQKILQDLRKFGDVTLNVGVIHELPLLWIVVMRKSCFRKLKQCSVIS